MHRKILDISPLISEKTAVFPGDRPFERNISMAFESGDHLGLSSVQTTLHMGAHTDAPSHYRQGADSIEKRELSRYFGSAQVIEVKIPQRERIRPEHIEGIEIRAPRVLFKTGSYPDPNLWTDHFNSLSPELIDYLSERGVLLVGIDTPSVDPADSKGLESHQRIFERDFSVLEGIVLSHIKEGLYTLVALPLRIEGADAAPVRAVLVEGELT